MPAERTLVEFPLTAAGRRRRPRRRRLRRGGGAAASAPPATLEPDGGLWVWKSPTLTGIDRGTRVKVWTAPPSGPRSRQIWAPELHFLRGRWYLYYTASDGVDANHRHYVLESVTSRTRRVRIRDRGARELRL